MNFDEDLASIADVVTDVLPVEGGVVLVLPAMSVITPILIALATSLGQHEAEIVDRLKEFAWHCDRVARMTDGSLTAGQAEVSFDSAVNVRDDILVELLVAIGVDPSDLHLPLALMGLAAPILANLLTSASSDTTLTAFDHLQVSKATNTPRTV